MKMDNETITIFLNTIIDITYRMSILVLHKSKPNRFNFFKVTLNTDEPIEIF